MSPNQFESLIRRNALACELAKHKRCKCLCGGALHGKVHSEEWIEEILEAGPPAKPGDQLKLVIVSPAPEPKS